MSSIPIIKFLTSLFSCREYTKLCCKHDISVLPFHERLIYWFHHLLCFTCRRFSKQISFLDGAVKKLITETPSFEKKCLSQESKKRISEKLHEFENN